MAKTMAKYPYTRARAVKTDTGGGSSVALGGTSTIYADAIVYREGETLLENVDMYEDAIIKDIIKIVEPEDQP